MTRDLDRRIASLERAAARGREDGSGLGELSRAELEEAVADCLVEDGADPATAMEAFGNLWRLGDRADDAATWGEMVALLPEALARHVADLRWRAELGGASPGHAARLEEAGFRHRVCALSARLWPPEGWAYERGFAWVVTRAAAGVPEAEIDHAAYYGPERGAAMAACAAAQLDRLAERRFRTEALPQPRDR